MYQTRVPHYLHPTRQGFVNILSARTYRRYADFYHQMAGSRPQREETGPLMPAVGATRAGIAIFEPRVWNSIVAKIVKEFEGDTSLPAVTALVRQVGQNQYTPVISIKFIAEKDFSERAEIEHYLKNLLGADGELKNNGFNSSVEIHLESNQPTGTRSGPGANIGLARGSSVPTTQAEAFAPRGQTPTIVRSPSDEGYESNNRDKKSVRHLTCFYFLNGGCKKSDEDCLYAHYLTGKLAERPAPVVPGGRPVAGRNAENEAMAYMAYQDQMRTLVQQTEACSLAAMQQATFANTGAYHVPYEQGVSDMPLVNPMMPSTPSSSYDAFGVGAGSPPQMGPLTMGQNDRHTPTRGPSMPSGRVPSGGHRLTVGAERYPDVFNTPTNRPSGPPMASSPHEPRTVPMRSSTHPYGSGVTRPGSNTYEDEPILNNARATLVARELCVGLDAGADIMDEVGGMVKDFKLKHAKNSREMAPALNAISNTISVGKEQYLDQRSRARSMWGRDEASAKLVFGSGVNINDH